jgi:hypothetical protein
MKEKTFASKPDIQRILESPVFKFNSSQEYCSIDDFGTTIKRLKENKESIPDYKIIIIMDRFARIYELFRPNQIKHSHFYWGTINTMDGIYYFLSSYLNIRNEYRFTNRYHSIIEQIKTNEKFVFEEIDWDLLIEHIHWVGLAIKKTIGMESLKVYSSLNTNIPYELKHNIKEYIRILFKDENATIEFLETSANQIKVNDQLVDIRSLLNY